MTYAVYVAEPKQPQILIRPPIDVEAAIRQQAGRADRSVGAHVIHILRIWLALTPEERRDLELRYDPL